MVSARCSPLQYFSMGEISVMQSILRRQLLATAARYADRPALWVDGESYTYEQLYDRAWRLAGAISRHEEEFCLLYCSKNLTRYIAILASVLAGKVFVPICPTSPISYCGRVVAQLGRAVYVLDSGDREREQRLLDLVDPTAPVISTWHTGRCLRACCRRSCSSQCTTRRRRNQRSIPAPM